MIDELLTGEEALSCLIDYCKHCKKDTVQYNNGCMFYECKNWWLDYYTCFECGNTYVIKEDLVKNDISKK